MYDDRQRWEQHPNPITDETLSGQTIKSREPLLINQWADTITDESDMPTLVGNKDKITQS